MVDTYIPTMYITTSQIEDKRIQILYILQKFTSIPSLVSDIFKDEEISMQKIRGEVGHNAELTINKVKTELTDVLRRTMPKDTVIVDTAANFIDDSRFNVEIDILVTTEDGDSVNVNGVIYITQDNQITFKSNEGE